MNITTAIIYAAGVAMTKVDSECLAKCSVEGQSCGRELDVCRQRLTEAFTEIHGTNNIEVLFPELGECLE